MNPDVLVVGAGPVGLTMAAELARYGASVRIVDKAAERSVTSKALVLWSRSLELIDRMGCGGDFVAAGLPATATNIFAGGRRIGHIRLDTVQTPHPYALMLPQSEMELLMEQQLNRCGVQVERSVELTGFIASASKVSAALRHADGATETLDTAWLIGCDGAHSTVRHGLGMEFSGDTLPSDWVLADVHLDGLETKFDELDLFWHEDGMLALFPITAGRYRVIADAGEADATGHRPQPTLDEVQVLLDRRGPGGVRAHDAVWLSAFRISERMVGEYRSGRVFLAGDAAHIHSPAGGQGMNTGIQDACNLAWKLAMVVRGLTSQEPLLSSYSIERSAVGRKVLEDTGRMTQVAVLRNAVAQTVRDHVAALMFGLSPVRETLATALSELSIGYKDSPLSRSGPRGLSPAAGQRAPVSGGGQPVGAGGSPRFALFAAAGEATQSFLVRHAALLEPEPRAPFAEGCVWLVRPDGYVAMVVRYDAWDTLDAYLNNVAGTGHATSAAPPSPAPAD